MKGKEDLLSTDIPGIYLENLQRKGYKLLGYYAQGSQVLGFADGFSDYDYVAVWKTRKPQSILRKRIAAALKLKAYGFRDIPAVKKSIDAFGANGNVVNVAHILDKDFFNFYKQCTRGEYEYLEERLLRLEGLKSGAILYDPTGKIRQYQKTIRVTPKIAAAIRKEIKEDLEYSLRQLVTTTKRIGSELYMYYLYQTVSNLRILLSLRARRFPLAAKWYETEEKNELVHVLKRIEKSLDKQKTTKQVLKLASRLGYKPSAAIHA